MAGASAPPAVTATFTVGDTNPRKAKTTCSTSCSQRSRSCARATPQNKLEIVRASQNLGECVNDAPALKQGGVGVAMGKNCSDVAREAANIILMDDNFSSIVRGIEQGRTICDNLKKAIAYTLTHLWPEIVSVALNLVVGMPVAFTTLQILSVNLVTELGPAISLANDGPENDIMSRPPRNMKKDKIISPALLTYAYVIADMVNTDNCFLAYATVFWCYGISMSEIYGSGDDYWKSYAPNFCYDDNGAACLSESEQKSLIAQACGSWYIALVLGQLFHVWMCKTCRTSIFRCDVFSNVVMVYGTLLSVTLAVVIVYVPSVNDVMGAELVDYAPWLLALGTGVITWL